MLYISRIAGVCLYGVMDTDDGVEDIVSTNDLSKAVTEYGVAIEGVTLKESFKSGSKPKLVIDTINVYQPTESLTPHQLKTDLFYGVAVTVKDGCIKSVVWDTQRLQDGARIRLSDFGTTCDNYVFMETPVTTKRVIIVVDDKVSVSKDTFKHSFGRGVVVDVREVTKKKLVERVYKSIIDDGDWRMFLTTKVIDSTERNEFWKAAAMLYKGISTPHEQREIGEKIGNYYYKEFSETAKCELVRNEAADFQRIIRRVAVNEAFWRSKCQDFVEVWERSRLVNYMVPDMLGRNVNRVTRFYRYFEQFIAPTKLCELYVIFTNRLMNWFLDMYQRGELS